MSKIVYMNKKARYLESEIMTTCFSAKKMAFVSGPRQSGKTTMAKHMLKLRKVGQYYNWDETVFRKQWTLDPRSVILSPQDSITPLLIFDEIHKAKLWKRSLKGIYDTLAKPQDILVTGSARLDVYRKGSDSLLGRYYNYRLHPFSLAEMLRRANFHDDETLLDKLFDYAWKPSKQAKEAFKLLYRFGPFPEPLFLGSMKHLNLWRRGRIEKIIREDLRDLSHLLELSQIGILVSMLPDRVASPLSLQSLSEDLEVAYTTIKRWLDYLNQLYYHFELKPYAKSSPRAIKKEKKIYLWDWCEITNEGARFENMIASHLLKYCHYLTDCGYGHFELYYMRNRQKKEIDFLLTKDGKPWFPVEVKLNDTTPSNNWDSFLKYLPCDRAIQLTKKENIFKKHETYFGTLLIISADAFLGYLV